jgi:hypothetical protein
MTDHPSVLNPRTPENPWNELRLKRNQLRSRINDLRTELDQAALTLKFVEHQLGEMKPSLAKTSLKTELERALASRKG